MLIQNWQGKLLQWTNLMVSRFVASRCCYLKNLVLFLATVYYIPDALVFCSAGGFPPGGKGVGVGGSYSLLPAKNSLDSWADTSAHDAQSRRWPWGISGECPPLIARANKRERERMKTYTLRLWSKAKRINYGRGIRIPCTFPFLVSSCFRCCRGRMPEGHCYERK